MKADNDCELKERVTLRRPKARPEPTRPANVSPRAWEMRKRLAERKADRIADLQTNLVSEVSKLMAQRKWPEELARLYLLHELNTLVGTVEVSAEVVPQPVE